MISYYVLMSPYSDSYSDIFLFLMNLRDLKTTDKAFYRLSLGWNWSGIFSWFSWGYVCWQEDHRGEVPFPSQHIMGRFHPHGLSFDVDLDHLVKVMSVSFLHCKTTLFPKLSILPSGRKLLCIAHTRGVRICSSSLKAVYLHKCCRNHLHGRCDYPSPLIK